MKIAFTGARGYIGQAFDRLNRNLDLIPLSYSLDKENYYSISFIDNKDLNELLNTIEVLIHFGSFTPKNNDQVQDKISSEKILKKINFRTRKSVEDAIKDLVLAFSNKKLVNTFLDDKFYNIKIIQKKINQLIND